MTHRAGPDGHPAGKEHHTVVDPTAGEAMGRAMAGLLNEDKK